MLIAIPSRARADQRNHTFDNLPPALREQAVFFVPRSETKAYVARFGSDHVVGVGVEGIGKTRQFILNYTRQNEPDDKVAMLDDGEILTWLHYCVSPRSVPLELPSTPMFLDAWLADAPLLGG